MGAQGWLEIASSRCMEQHVARRGTAAVSVPGARPDVWFQSVLAISLEVHNPPYSAILLLFGG